MSQPTDTVQQEFLQLYGREAWLDWQRLLAHFELGEGFSFLVLLLPGAVGADICRRHLAGQLAAKGKRLAELPCDWHNDARSVTESLFALPATADLGGIWLGSVIPESDPEISRWKEAWRLGLAALNQQRNALLRRFHCPLVLVGAPWLNPLLREAAPDLWSVRAAVVMVTAAQESASLEPSFAGDDRQMIQPESFAATTRPDEITTDPDYALERAERLRGQAGSELARARLLLRAGNGFFEHARFDAAERSLQKAADLFGGLADKSPELLSDWAGSLNNLANVLSYLGRPDEALAKAEDAVRIYTQLVQARPDAFLSSLATSLNSLANALGDVGRNEEALTKAEEAVQIYVLLAQSRRDAFLPELAAALNNLANRLSDLGWRKEALARAQEAVRIREQLAQKRPDVFLPKLATSLNNLANRLSDMGRREEALAQAQEAVRIYAQLAKAQPEAFMSNLAASRNNLAIRLSDLGRREEALAESKETVMIYSQLAQERPNAFLRNLAMSLNNLANRLSELERPEEALAKAEEALRICKQLAHSRPDTSLPDLAGALNNLATILSNLGRREEALAKAEEGIQIFAQLAHARPDAFLPGLAMSWGVHGTVLQGMENHVQAAASFAESIRALTPVFLKTPPAFAQLIGGLCRSYIQACESAKTEPDQSLLAPVREVLEELEQNKPKE